MINKPLRYFRLVKISTVFSLLFTICASELKAQCDKEITIEKRPYCILLYPNEALFSTIENEGISYIVPRQGMLDYGAYVVYDKRSKRILMEFYTDQRKQVSGGIIWYNKQDDGKIQFIFSCVLADGNYNFETSSQFKFPIKLFSFSQEKYEKINKQIFSKYFSMK